MKDWAELLEKERKSIEEIKNSTTKQGKITKII